MKFVTTAARLLLGLLFTVFGVNYFLHFIPVPPPDRPEAGDFLGLLHGSGYLTAVKCFEITGGLLLLVGRFVPLGLVLLTPVIVNIVFYEVFLLHKPGPGGVALVLDAVLLVAYRRYLTPFFRPGSGTGDPA